MSDASLRRDEREADDPGAEVRVLSGRLRTGQLDTQRLELAAWVGHPASSKLLEVPDRPPLPLPELLTGLERWGHAALVRGLLAIGDAVTPRLPPAQRLAAEVLCDQVRSWLDGGGQAKLDGVLEAAERLRRHDAAPRGLDAVLNAVAQLWRTEAPLQPNELRARVWGAMEDHAPASPQDAAVMAIGLTAWITARAAGTPDRLPSLRRFVGWVRRTGLTDADMRQTLCERVGGWAVA